MKTTFTFLFFYFTCQVLFAQLAPGISVQGIARDAGKAALVDQELTFTFDIQNAAGGTSYYKEDVDIRTDPYGVFSHIIGTGTKLAGSGNFNEIPFSQTHMKLVIIVNYGGTDVVVSNSPFQYTPYAKTAENGVPTGTIVAFAGEEADIPAGWVLCDGRSLTLVNGSLNLRNLIGDNAPDLKGMFLRGTGVSPVNAEEGPALRAMQDDGFESHLHNEGTLELEETGAHAHNHVFRWDWAQGNFDTGDTRRFGDNSSQTDGNHNDPTSSAGAHTHTVLGSTGSTGITETRPVNYGVNYIIKL